MKRTTFWIDAKAASELKAIGKRLGNLTLAATIRFALADWLSGSIPRLPLQDLVRLAANGDVVGW